MKAIVAIAVIVGVWALAIVVALIPMPSLGYIGLGIGVLWWLAIVVAVRALGSRFLGRWMTLTTTLVTLLMAASLLNWNSVAPGAWFTTHRWLYDHAVVSASPGNTYYGAKLPLWLQPLTANGQVSMPDSMMFFPQWTGIPDDAGGYFWSPGEPPEGVDMYGMLCQDPVDLGGGWWMCGM